MKKLITIAALTALTFNVQNAFAGLSSHFHIYFNRPVNTAVSSGTNAQYIGAGTVDTIAAYINRAKYSVDVAQYDFTAGTHLDVISNAINAAYTRGVVVRWIDDGSQANTGVANLNAGISVVSRPTNSNGYIMHNKFMIIDANAPDTTLSVVYTASMDWGLEQDDSDFNNTVFIQSHQLAQAYTAQFNQMWGGSGSAPVVANEKFGSAKVDLGPHIITIDGIEVEVYFSPADSSNSHILDAIASANSQLYFGMYTFSDRADAPPINAKFTAGVDVDGIIDQFTLSTPTSQWSTLLGTLGASRLKEYVQPNSIYHNKYLIVDACNVNSDPLVETGSHNWTVTADEDNDENIIIMHDPTIANIYYQAFNANFAYMGGTITGCTVNVTCNNVISTTTQVNNNVLCYGASTGSATVHAHGAGVPFSYAWSFGGQTDSTLSNVPAGTYTVTVTDHNSCSVTASVTITQPAAALSVTGTPTASGCAGNTGSVSTTVSGGTSTYTYKWNTSPQQTTATATGLSAGNYTVTVTDANSCTASASAAVTSSGGGITLSTSSTATGCGQSSGTVSVTVTSGTGPFTYHWSTGATTAQVSSLAASTYTVTVSNTGGCSATASAVVAPAAQISVTCTPTGVSCAGNNGTISTSVSGGSGSYTYAWGTSPQQTTSEATGLAAGTYTVTVTDTHSCTATASATVTQTGSGLTLSTGSTATGCGQSTGSVTVTVTSGPGTYTYHWSNGASTVQVSSLGAGTYTVTVTAAGGCSATASAAVTSAGGPTVTATSTATTCGNSNGTANVTASGGASPYTYAWTGGGTAQSISNLAAGTYNVTVTDAGHCQAVANTTVAASTAPALSVTSTGASCGGNNGSATATVSGGTTPYTYAWSNSANTAVDNNIRTGTYRVTITDHAGCTASASVQVDSTGAQPVTLTATGTAICGNDTVTICAPSGLTAYNWSNGQHSDCINVQQPGTYTVTVTSGVSCTVTSAPEVITTGEPPVVTVTVTDNITNYVLNCSPAYTYQWYKNGTAIPGATTNVYVAWSDGIYTVNAGSSNGCSTLSQQIDINFTGIASLAEDVIKIYPNPSSDYWQLEAPATWNGAAYELYSANGDLIAHAQIEGTTAIKCPLAQGIYILKITSGQQSVVKKVIKM